MKKRILLSSVLLLSLSAQAGMYRWVDESGNVHFSDKVPAAASKKAHSELNKRGNVKKMIDPEAVIKKDKELALYDDKLKKQFLLDQIKKDAEKIVQKRDAYLLSTYENKGELKHSFESKISMLQGSARIIEAQNEVLEKKLTKLKTQKTSVHSKSLIKSIAIKIVDINDTIEQYKQALQENDQHVSKLSLNYKEDLSRYIQLTE